MENQTVDHERSLKMLTKLLNASDLRTTKRLAKQLTITRSAFADLILVAKSRDLEAMPYYHKANIFRYTPEHLIPTDEEMAAFGSNGPGRFKGKAKKFSNKIFQSFEERKWIVGHMFHTPTGEFWHLFYFDTKDMNEEDNHWKVGGKHIHYISFLWQQFSISNVWTKLQSGSKDFGSNVHIRYVE